MSEDKLRKTEQLLQEAAGWEPQGAAPERLAQRALLAALEQERSRPRRPSPLIILAGVVFGGGAASAALSGALLMVMRPVADVPIGPAPTPKATLVNYRSHLPVETAGVERAPEPVRPRARQALAPRPATRRRFQPTLVSSAPRRPLPRAVWSTQEVEKRETGVIAGGVVVTPDPQTGALYLLPAVVDIPVSSSTACGPLPDMESGPQAAPAETDSPETDSPEPTPAAPASGEPAATPAPQPEPLP